MSRQRESNTRPADYEGNPQKGYDSPTLEFERQERAADLDALLEDFEQALIMGARREHRQSQIGGES